jgi:gliding motility-associated-like protein
VILTATPTTGYAPLDVEFTATASQNVSQYTWDMGSTTYSTTTDTTSFIYTAAGNYTVTVIVTDNNGCTDSATVTIVVDEEITLEIPNVFTPNGDGTNDLFVINTTGIDQMTVSIYDRWGVLIAVVEGVNAGWDGRAVNGLSAVDGTYYFVLEYVTYRGEAMNKTGFVTLLH